jgi:hypothetical protein
MVGIPPKGAWHMSFLVTFYFGRPYISADLAKVVGAFSLVADPERFRVFVGPSLGSDGMRKSKPIDLESWRAGHEQNSHAPDATSKVFPFVNRIEGELSAQGRPYKLWPYEHEDGSVTYQWSIGLRPGAEREPLGPMLQNVFAEGDFMRLLGATDPLWSCVGVAPYPPSADEILRGDETLPLEAGYFGGSLVKAMGKEVLLGALRECQKVFVYDGGGLFFAWTWRGGTVVETEAYDQFAKVIRARSSEAVRAVVPKIDARSAP